MVEQKQKSRNASKRTGLVSSKLEQGKSARHGSAMNWLARCSLAEKRAARGLGFVGLSLLMV